MNNIQVIDYKNVEILKNDAILTVNGYIDKLDINLGKDELDNTYLIKSKASKLYRFIDSNGFVINKDIKYTNNTEFFPKYKDPNDNTYLLISKQIINKDIVELFTSNVFYHNSLLQAKFNNPKAHYCKFNNMYHDLYNHDLKNAIKYGEYSPTYLLSEGKRYTFGVEIETSLGLVPLWEAKDLNIAAVYDGSLKDDNGNKLPGAEYVTGILTGDMGFKHLQKICNVLQERCEINKKCSIHVHLGGINFNKETVVFLYLICQSIQDSIFKMLAPSRTNNEYCKMLPIIVNFNEITRKLINNSVYEYNLWIETSYNDIIKFVSNEDICGVNINKKNDHPRGFKCGYDHSSARYCWINFVPAIFDTRGNNIRTIEFRPHQGSLSYIKIKNWILILMGICSMAENNKKDILNKKNIKLSNILKLTYPKINHKLTSYILQRINKFIEVKDLENLEYVNEDKNSESSLFELLNI